MAKLYCARTQQMILGNLCEAKTIVSRTKGLLGTSDLASDSGLWIHQCNSIHTFFMRYALDCIFLDKQMQVCKLIKNVKPGQVVWPIWQASSVIEIKAGVLQNMNIETGDQLYVGA